MTLLVCQNCGDRYSLHWIGGKCRTGRRKWKPMLEDKPMPEDIPTIALTPKGEALRDRILIAAATPDVDQHGLLRYTEAPDGTAASLSINDIDLFRWFATAWKHGLRVHVQLHCEPDSNG